MKQPIKVKCFSLLKGQGLKVSLLSLLRAHVTTSNINSFWPPELKVSVEPFKLSAGLIIVLLYARKASSKLCQLLLDLQNGLTWPSNLPVPIFLLKRVRPVIVECNSGNTDRSTLKEE